MKATDRLKQVEGVVREMTLDELRGLIGIILDSNPNSGKFWDIITCQRGPDSPSERGDLSEDKNEEAYRARRERKFKTVEVIRAASFGGVVGGAARSHKGSSVTLPPHAKWDHFDRHVHRAATVLGLDIKIEKE